MYAPPRQLPYAPTPYSYTPNSTPSATINLDEEVKLTTDPSSRDLYDSLAEIYSIIVTLDAVEKAYTKDSVTEAEYTATCTRLLKHYRTILADDTVAREFGDLETFKWEWDIACPRAIERIRIGLPATVSDATTSIAPSHAHPAPSSGGRPPPSGSQPSGPAISDATENFITFMDALKIKMFAKDSLHPLLTDVIQSVNKVTEGADFEGRGKIVQWLITLNGMKATEEISEEMARDLAFDIDGAYYGFKATLK
ncbi:MAG: Vacuolar protein-sorting-associated protein 28 [Piccolia ochrophora]|nr:MAG: Vacuolar protein-sorting-associated protein 28 [Piccolia ochrophora]